MKKIFNKLAMLLVIFIAASCGIEEQDDMTGKYALDSYTMTKVSQQQTTKLGKGVKKIEVSLTDNSGNVLQLAFGSKEWTLPAVSYSYMPSTDGSDYSSAVTDGGFAAKLLLNGSTAVSLGSTTSVTVDKNTDGSYSILLVSLIDGQDNVRCSFSGNIDFEIGEDDPEASGYTIAVVENAVTDANYTVYPDLTKYMITVSDPNGNAVVEVDAVNAAGLSLAQLVGTYTAQGYPTEQWLMDNGWVVYMPEYSLQMAGGTYFTDANGTKQYVTSGQITITSATDADGNALYSFSGTGLSSLSPINEASTDGAFNILFATQQ